MRAQALAGFRYGQASLQCPTGQSCLFDWAGSRGPARRLMLAQRWDDLADVVLAAHYDQDLPWFYLGLAAAGLNQNDAARSYLDQSIRHSLIGGTQTCLPNLCDGINLPADAQSLMARLPSSVPPAGVRRQRRVARPAAVPAPSAAAPSPVEPAAAPGWVQPVPTQP